MTFGKVVGERGCCFVVSENVNLLAPNFAFGDVAFPIQKLNLVDTVKERVVAIRPNDFPAGCHFDQLRLLADMSVAEIIAKERVPIGQTGASRHQSQRIFREILFIKFPNNFFVSV